MTSIRRFLVVVLLATITLVNFLAALHGYRTSMAEADQLFDAQLADIAMVLAATTRGSAAVGDSSETPSSITFQVWRSGLLEDSSSGAPAIAIAELAPGYSDVNFSGYRWRAFSRYIEDTDRWLIVAERTDIRFALAESIILESVLPTILGLPLVGLLVWFIVGRGLRPLRNLVDEMGSKQSNDLSPVTDTNPPEELKLLIDSINGLLFRLNASFERERRFSADAAHELRTPISVLKVQLHNLLRDADEVESLLTLQTAVERMEHSVEQVLMLYRTEPDQFAANFTDVDIAGLARQIIAELYPQLEAKGQQIELVGDKQLLPGDAFALRTLLLNLIGNASKYSGESGELRVSIKANQDAVVLKVEDSGPGIPVDQREKVFERFYRMGSTRHDTSVPGAGIGLTIVQHVAEIHGASIELADSDFASGLAVVVKFPLLASTGPGL